MTMTLMRLILCLKEAVAQMIYLGVQIVTPTMLHSLKTTDLDDTGSFRSASSLPKRYRVQGFPISSAGLGTEHGESSWIRPN